MDWDIVFGGKGYNLFNSLTYGLLIILLALVFFKLAKKYKITVTKEKILLLVPFTIYFSFLRSLADKNLFSSFIFTSPTLIIIGFSVLAGLQAGVNILREKVPLKPRYFIYLANAFLAAIPFYYVLYKNSADFFGLVFFLVLYFIALFSLIFIFRPKENKIISMKEEYKLWAFAYLIPLIPAIYIFLNYAKNYYGLMLVFLVSTTASLLFLLASKKTKIDFYSKAALIAHFWDASATYISVDFFGWWEKHIFVRFISDITGTALSFFLLKIIAIGLFLFVINKGIKNEKLKRVIKAVVFIMGIATGTRDAVSLTIV